MRLPSPAPSFCWGGTTAVAVRWGLAGTPTAGGEGCEGMPASPAEGRSGGATTWRRRASVAALPSAPPGHSHSGAAPGSPGEKRHQLALPCLRTRATRHSPLSFRRHPLRPPLPLAHLSSLASLWLDPFLQVPSSRSPFSPSSYVTKTPLTTHHCLPTGCRSRSQDCPPLWSPCLQSPLSLGSSLLIVLLHLQFPLSRRPPLCSSLKTLHKDITTCVKPPCPHSRLSLASACAATTTGDILCPK